MVGRCSPQGVRAWFSRTAFSGFDVAVTGRGRRPFPRHDPKRRIFRAISPLPKHFLGISVGAPTVGHVGAAAKYRADGDHGLPWRDALSDGGDECILTSLP